MEQCSKTHNLCVWIKGFGINFHYFPMNIFIGSRDNDTFMAIMALPNEWLSLFGVKKPLKAQNTTSWNTPCVTTKCTLAADAFKRVPHCYYPGFSKGRGMVESLPAISKSDLSSSQFPKKLPTNVKGWSQLGHINGSIPV
jgi:hypothetical protein